MKDVDIYISNFGNFDFKDLEFNNVDNLILSMISYVNFDNVRFKNKTTLKEISRMFFEMNDEIKIYQKFSLVNDDIEVFKHAATTKRFGNIKVLNYINKVNYEEEKQFSAMIFVLDDKTKYIAYRGTDDTILGWKEDFNMSFTYPIPAQIEALEYLNKNISIFDRQIRIGGHSKGGNLAIYAGVNCHKYIQNKIINIYSNDGPGFCKEFIESEKFIKMQEKIIKIVPENSIIGMLLEHSANYKVVKSNNKGIMQHDPNSWMISNNDFIYIEQVNNNSKFLDYTLSSWLEKMNDKDREEFVDSLFLVFEECHIYEVNDLYNINIIKIISIIKAMGKINRQYKKILIRTVTLLVKEFNKNIFNKKKLYKNV